MRPFAGAQARRSRSQNLVWTSHYFRFVCPNCGEQRATVNPRNNLAHCFCCKKNLNNIDLLIELDYDILAAVALLERWLKEHEARK